MKKKKLKKCEYCKKEIEFDLIICYYDDYIEVWGVKMPIELKGYLHPWCAKLSDYRMYSKEQRICEVNEAKELYKEWKIEREKKRYLNDR